MYAKNALFLLMFISVIDAQTAVKDFAPLKIGNVWEYAYLDTTYNRQLGVTIIGSYIEQSNARIEVKDVHISGSDTFYILYCTRTGVAKKTYYTDTTDSIISVADNDSIVANSSGIFLASGFKCPIGPVYSSHTFDTASNLEWDRIVINEDTLIRILPTNPHSSVYVQDIGAVMYKKSIIVNSAMIFQSAVLFKFNERPITLHVPVTNMKKDIQKFSDKIAPDRPVIFLNLHNKFTIPGVMLNGASVTNARTTATLPFIIRRPDCR